MSDAIAARATKFTTKFTTVFNDGAFDLILKGIHKKPLDMKMMSKELRNAWEIVMFDKQYHPLLFGKPVNKRTPPAVKVVFWWGLVWVYASQMNKDQLKAFEPLASQAINWMLDQTDGKTVAKAVVKRSFMSDVHTQITRAIKVVTLKEGIKMFINEMLSKYGAKCLTVGLPDDHLKQEALPEGLESILKAKYLTAGLPDNPVTAALIKSLQSIVNALPEGPDRAQAQGLHDVLQIDRYEITEPATW